MTTLYLILFTLSFGSICAAEGLTQSDLNSPGRYAKRCMNGNNTTMSMITCDLEELDLWDASLAQRLKNLMLSGKGNDTQLFKETLKASQDAWKLYRDAECAHKSSIYLGGSMAGVVSVMCHLNITAERVIRLGQYD